MCLPRRDSCRRPANTCIHDSPELLRASQFDFLQLFRLAGQRPHIKAARGVFNRAGKPVSSGLCVCRGMKPAGQRACWPDCQRYIGGVKGQSAATRSQIDSESGLSLLQNQKTAFYVTGQDPVPHYPRATMAKAVAEKDLLSCRKGRNRMGRAEPTLTQIDQAPTELARIGTL